MSAEKQCMYSYLDDNITFRSEKAAQIRTIYAPLCGTDGTKIKSSITPFLSGDIKIDKFKYVTKPVSTEDLRNNLRNFFVDVEGKGICSLADFSDGPSYVEVGQLFHKLVRQFDEEEITLSALTFVPTTGENIELTQVTVTNDSSQEITMVPTASIPLFARALANKHDHEHVTSLLHRTKQVDCGVVVTPCMAFNEEGHKNCDDAYYVFGIEGNGNLPVGSFPTFESFYGDSGTDDMPEAILNSDDPEALSDYDLQGKEVAGAIRFETVMLKPGESKEYIVMVGIESSEDSIKSTTDSFNSLKKIEKALQINKQYWKQKSFSIEFKTGRDAFNSWMQWATIQPVLRRIYGCSFLPDHDYGKGGKGWRDIWQDLLSLILIEPNDVRQTLIDNFGGVRIDGSNATIIGDKPGEFFADRNAITRVWMDHGVWPLKTILLYIHQTGDFNILLENNTYFRDPQMSRTFIKDDQWTPEYGNKVKTKDGKFYQGSILEHLLLQNLVQFFNVGEHNNIRLESADWNDGLDMAFARGESVTFSACYAGNLLELADLIEKLAEVSGDDSIIVAKEMKHLLDTLETVCDYDSVQAKQDLLYKKYCPSVQPELSGEVVKLKIADIAGDLRKKGQWIFDHINTNEKVTVDADTWFNGYYDNQAKRVEGKHDEVVRMTLTGQVFPVMSGLASDQDVAAVVKAANKYLKDSALGGYRLNSNFQLKHYLDLGRAFGFAFGTKENGAFFSHMIVMYAYALYARGFAKEGFEVLESIYQMCIDTDRSKIYPGIPEYIDSTGRGLYHYLTGSASWLVLTQLTQVFGVRGEFGDLILDPKLVKQEFNQKGVAEISCQFAGKRITVRYINESLKDVDQYSVESVSLNLKEVPGQKKAAGVFVVPRAVIAECSQDVVLEAVLS